jgi:hypothetical protein
LGQQHRSDIISQRNSVRRPAAVSALGRWNDGMPRSWTGVLAEWLFLQAPRRPGPPLPCGRCERPGPRGLRRR